MALLGSTVVSAAIDSLSEDAAVSSWVHEGLALHRDKAIKRCLFCDQTLTEDRLAALEAHFDTEYEQLLNKLDAKITEISEASRAVAACALPNRAELYGDLVAEYDMLERLWTSKPFNHPVPR